jgi:hypothetical protein
MMQLIASGGQQAQRAGLSQSLKECKVYYSFAAGCVIACCVPYTVCWVQGS